MGLGGLGEVVGDQFLGECEFADGDQAADCGGGDVVAGLNVFYGGLTEAGMPGQDRPAHARPGTGLADRLTDVILLWVLGHGRSIRCKWTSSTNIVRASWYKGPDGDGQ